MTTDEAGTVRRARRGDGVRRGGRQRTPGRTLLVALVAPLLAACVVVGTPGRDGAPGPVPAPDTGELPTVPLRVLEAPGATLALVPVSIAG